MNKLLYPESLKNDSLRLLQIDSGPLEPLRCTLSTFSLAALPAYTCLSYTWSDPFYHALDEEDEPHLLDGIPGFPIICNSHEVLITENLRDALLEFSKNNVEREKYMWIDGVCINQQDMPERQFQVSMMGQIYSGCRNVIVWLGKEDISSPSAIEVISALSSISPDKYKSVQFTDLQDWDLYEKLGIEVIVDYQWVYYAAFLQRTWFRRIWVVQEAFLPPKIVVVCGSDVIKWVDIVACAKILRETGLGTTLLKLLVTRVNGMNEVSEVSEQAVGSTVYVNNTINNQSIFQKMRETMQLGKERLGKELGLEKLLYYSRYFDATNAKDKIYGVYGIWGEGGKKIPDDMTPQYSADVGVEKVYTRAAWEMMLETNDLNVLSLVEDCSLVGKNSVREEGKLPSWVPDFDSPSIPQLLAGNPRLPPGSERWNASKNLRFVLPRLPPPERQHLLPISGYRIDTICDRAATQAEIMGDEFKFTTVLELLAKYPDQAYPDGKTESCFEAFWRAFMKDTFRKLPATDNARRTFQYFVAVRTSELIVEHEYSLKHAHSNPPIEALFDKTKDLIVSLSKHKHNKGLIPSWEDVMRIIDIAAREDLELPEKVALEQDYSDIYEAFRIAYSGRRLFRTRKGYLGIAAQALELEDEVWIVAGVKVPVLLRRHNENWRLVGEAYVHGIMESGLADGVGKVENTSLD